LSDCLNAAFDCQITINVVLSPNSRHDSCYTAHRAPTASHPANPGKRAMTQLTSRLQ